MSRNIKTEPALWELEPFACGFLQEESENISRKIAAGMKAVCQHLPLKLDPVLKLASTDPEAESPLFTLGAAYRFGDGIAVNLHLFENKKERFPELADQLDALYQAIKPYDTFDFFQATITEEEHNIMRSKTLWAGTWGGHSNPDYGRLLRLGTDGIRALIARGRAEHPDADEWYKASLTVLDGIDLLAERFRELAVQKSQEDPENAPVYGRIAQALTVVPRHPATDFMTALQSFYLVFTLDGRDSPGAFDQYMAPYYPKTPPEEARELLEGLWQGFYRTRIWNLSIGGSDEFGRDLTNDLSYAILDVADKYRYNTPNLTARCHKNSSDRFLRRCAELLSTGIALPAMYNDEVVCPALEELGIPPHDAHLYTLNGCNQIDIQGKSHMGLEDGEVNLLKCLEYALFDGRCLIWGTQSSIHTGDARTFRTFEELFEAYQKQVEHAVSVAVTLANRSQEVFSKHGPNPLRSCLTEGCLEKGLDFKAGGPIYNHGQILTEGLADAIDSLEAIRHFVYETGTYTMQELLDALESDFDGREDMRLTLLHYPEKFGNDREKVDSLGARVLEHFFRELMKHRTFRGGGKGIYGGGLSTFERAASNGKGCGASADGRHARDGNIAESAGPVPGRDVCGPTAVIRSALHFDQKLAKSGFVLMLKFDKTLFGTEQGINGFLGLVKTYFREGGQMLVASAVSQEELLDAEVHPERHRDLIVRVGGYSDYFVNLSEPMRQNVIARTVSGL